MSNCFIPAEPRRWVRWLVQVPSRRDPLNVALGLATRSERGQNEYEKIFQTGGNRRAKWLA